MYGEGWRFEENGVADRFFWVWSFFYLVVWFGVFVPVVVAFCLLFLFGFLFVWVGIEGV